MFDSKIALLFNEYVNVIGTGSFDDEYESSFAQED